VRTTARDRLTLRPSSALEPHGQRDRTAGRAARQAPGWTRPTGGRSGRLNGRVIRLAAGMCESIAPAHGPHALLCGNALVPSLRRYGAAATAMVRTPATCVLDLQRHRRNIPAAPSISSAANS